MKIKLSVSDENYEEIEKFFLEKGIEIDDNASFVLTEQDKYVSHLAVREPEENKKLHISTEEILYIESYGHTVEVHTIDKTYQTTDRLYQLCYILDPTKFLRISSSVIIARNKVKEIKPTFSMKFILVMINGDRVDVTRSYYNIFKEFFRI